MDSSVVEVSSCELKDWHFSVSKNFVLKSQLSVEARFLLIVLKSFQGLNNHAWPSRDLLCSIMNCGKDSLTRYLRELKETDHLHAEQRKIGGRFKSNVYIPSMIPCPKNSYTEIQATTDTPLRYISTKDVPVQRVRTSDFNLESEQVQARPEPEDVRAIRIYEVYPKKVARPAALKAISRVLKKVQYDALLEKTRLFAKAWEGAPAAEMEFCPHPSTWFNQERYNDDPAGWGPRHRVRESNGLNLKQSIEILDNEIQCNRHYRQDRNANPQDKERLQQLRRKKAELELKLAETIMAS